MALEWVLFGEAQSRYRIGLLTLIYVGLGVSVE